MGIFDYDQAKQQLKTLGYAKDETVYLRALGGKSGPVKFQAKAGNLPIEEIDTYQIKGAGIYFVVNGGGQTDSQVKQCRAIWFEHDDLDQEIQAGLWQDLGLPEPTLQLNTGGKSIHNYWVFDTPIPPKDWKPLQTDLLEMADADRSLKNPSRVMRLAGAFHQATGEQSKIILNTGKRYSYEELRAIIPTKQAPQAPTPQPTISKSDDEILLACLAVANRGLVNSGAAEGTRNSNGAALARDLIGTTHWLRSKGHYPNPRGLFDSYCGHCSLPLEPREAETIWKSAEASSPGPSLSEDKLENCFAAATGAWKKTDKTVPTERDFGSKGDDSTVFSEVSATPETPENDSEDTLEDVQEELETLQNGVNRPAPIEQLIPHFATPLKNLAGCLNLPVGAYALTLFPAAGSLIHAKTRLEISPITDFYAPPIVWGGLVGESSAVKSPIYRAIVGPLNAFQSQAWQDFQQKQDEYEIDLEEWESKKKNKKEIADPGTRPKPPILRRYCVQNATPEAIGKILQEQQDRGFLTAVDELATLVKGMNQYKAGGTGNERSLWLSAYDAGPWSQERKSGPDVYAPHSSISVAGTIQPSTLRRLMGKLNEVDGFWPRFMWCWLPGDRVPPPGEVPHFDLSGLLKDAYEQLANQPEQTLKFDAHGRQLWRAWHEWIEDQRAKQPIEAIRAIYRKSMEQAGRVALIAHCLNAAYAHGQPNEIIPAETLKAAIHFTQWAISQALYIYGQFGLTETPETKKYLAICSRFRGMTQVKPKPIQRAWGRVDIKETHKIIDSLIQMGLAADNKLTGPDRRVDFLTRVSVDLLTDHAQSQTPQGVKSVNKSVDQALTVLTNFDDSADSEQKRSTVNKQSTKNVDHQKSCQESDSGVWSTSQQNTGVNFSIQPGQSLSPGQPVEVKHPTVGWANGYYVVSVVDGQVSVFDSSDPAKAVETYPLNRVRACGGVA